MTARTTTAWFGRCVLCGRRYMIATHHLFFRCTSPSRMDRLAQYYDLKDRYG